MLRTAFVAATTAAALFASAAAAQMPSYVRILSGSAGGNYFPMAGLLANAISNPPGSRPCDQGGSCGVPGLIAIAQSSNGSSANVQAIQNGTAETGLAQSDVVHWAYTGTGSFDGREPMNGLRLIATLFPEHVHVALAKESKIASFQDLKGKKISIGPANSGAQIGALLLLETAGMQRDADYVSEEFNISLSAELLADGDIDAFVTVVGAPSSGIAQMASTVGVKLLAVPDPIRNDIVSAAPFYFLSPIPANAYQGVEAETPTVAVAAQWVVSSAMPDDLVYGMTKALWNETTRRLLDLGHVKGKEVQLDSALEARGAPLHPGAERFYKEIGRLQ